MAHDAVVSNGRAGRFGVPWIDVERRSGRRSSPSRRRLWSVINRNKSCFGSRGQHRGNRGCMFFPPFAQGNQGLAEAAAERRQCIVHARWNFLVVGARDDAVQFHFFQLLDQHFVADASHASLQFAVAFRPMGQEKKDQRLPFASNHPQCGIEATDKRRDFRVFRLHVGYLPKGAYLSERQLTPILISPQQRRFGDG